MSTILWFVIVAIVAFLCGVFFATRVKASINEGVEKGKDAVDKTADKVGKDLSK